MFLRFFIIFLLLISFSHKGFSSIPPFTYAIHEDTQNLSFEEIETKEFTAINSSSINLGFTASTVWLKINIHSLKDNSILKSQSLTHDTIDVFCLSNGKLLNHQQFGAFCQNKNQYGTNKVILDIHKDFTEIYIKIQAHSFIIDDFDIIPKKEYNKLSNSYATFLGIVMGILILMLFYNVLLYFKINEKAHLYYALFITCMLILNSYAEGIGISIIWNSFPKFNFFAEPIAAALGTAGLSLYVRRVFFNQIKKKWLNYILLGLIVISPLPVVFAFILPNEFVSQFSQTLSFISLLIGLFTAIYSLIKGNEYAKFFILGWSIFIAGVSGRIMYNAGVIEYSNTIHIMHHLGSIIEAFIFTWLISRYLKEEKDKNIEHEATIAELNTRLTELKTLLKTTSSTNDLLEEDVENINQILKTPLSKRELDVLIELSKGLTYQQIAEALFVSKSTIKTHTISIYQKLDVSNRTEAINKAKNSKTA